MTIHFTYIYVHMYMPKKKIYKFNKKMHCSFFVLSTCIYNNR